jgi:exodeoxyribonuclease V alpha subunit
VLDLGAVVQGELFPTNPAPSTDPTPATGPTPSDHPGAATDLVPSLPPAAIDTPAISPVGPPTRGSGTRAVAADRQRLAAEAALTRRLVVLAGGPGTGKTRTVARLLAAAHDAAARAGTRLDVALAAPTGKAAARMTEAVHHEVAVAMLADDLAASLLATEATTIHRLLGRTSGVEFRHDRANPLAADIVVVDEASMVSLPLMARLLDAVRPDARLVLVGDPYQLASIEAGAVLGDVAGGTAVARPRTGALVDSVIVLERVHRFGADSTIAALATAIRDGDADAALALLQAGRDDVRWIRPDDRASLAQLERTVRDASVAVVRAALDGDEQAGLAAAADLKVLAATRRGPGGTYDWRERIERAVGRAEPRAKIGWRYYTGRPVIITRNDYLNGLMNGDTGLVVQHDGEAQVVFPAGEGPRWFHPSQLSAVETWWSMTIHKSQGSEYRHAVVSLPAAPSPILTRELLYTAVTRAKQQVTLVASEEAVRAAIGRPVSRASGLLDRLWPPA